MRKLAIAILLTTGVLLFPACSQGEQGQDEEATQQPTITQQSPTTALQAPTTQVKSGEQVMVGGFTVEGAGVPDAEVPEVTASREAVRKYLSQIQPTTTATARDISETIKPRAGISDGGITLKVDTEAVREARSEARKGLERLREIDPPRKLEPVHAELIVAYENVLPAYNNIINASESRDPGDLAPVVEENLPQIEQFDNEVTSIVQDLQQAANEG
jgi:hypothetical protein